MTHGWEMKPEQRLKDVVWTTESPFSEYLIDLKRINMCPESRKYYDKVIKNNPNITLGNLLKEFPPEDSWARSAFIKHYMPVGSQDITPEQYQIWIKMIKVIG